MDQAESSPSPGQPEPGQPARRDPPPRAAEDAPPPQAAKHAPPPQAAKHAQPTPRPDGRAEPAIPALRLEHPVVAGYDGSASSRNALAYAAGLSTRLHRPLLIVYVCSSGVYCEPLTGQVVGVPRDADALERWLLAELDQVTGQADIDVHVRTRRGSPARELAATAEEFTADALVIGAPTHIWHRIAGSVPSWLARHARCPVIVVP
jgi:nucleotide-binding universal stress UspA family protein